MAIVNSKPMRRVGVGAQYICFWEKEQTDNQIAFAANVTKLKTVASIQTTEERSESKVFGSNEVYDVDTSAQRAFIYPEAARAAQAFRLTGLIFRQHINMRSLTKPYRRSMCCKIRIIPFAALLDRER